MPKLSTVQTDENIVPVTEKDNEKTGLPGRRSAVAAPDFEHDPPLLLIAFT